MFVPTCCTPNLERILQEIPNTELQEYVRSIKEVYVPGSSQSYFIPTIQLGFPIRGSH